jgi:uncharacterized iron-regulated protein
MAACANLDPPPATQESLEGRIWDLRAGHFIDQQTLIEDLAQHHYVLLGEKHDNPEHHLIQALLLAQLAMEGRRPAVAFEMLSADFTPILARILARSEVRVSDLRAAVYWDEGGWPDWVIYEPLFVTTLALRLRILGADFGRNDLESLSESGLAGLGPPLRQRLGLDQPSPPEQLAAHAEAIRIAHCGLVPEEIVPRMAETQLARDAQMARTLVDAAAMSGGDGAVLIAGFGHVGNDWAVPFSLRRFDPKSSVASVAILEVPRPGSSEAADFGAQSRAVMPFDYLWYTARLDDLDPCEQFGKQLEKLRHKK